MTQPTNPVQVSLPESCLISLSNEAKEAPCNEAAVLAVEFSVIANKAALGSLQAFCTFLGKVHETGAFSSWPSGEKRGEKGAGVCPIPCESLTKEGEMQPSEECCQQAAINFELNLTPFSFPAAFCEQFIRETITFTVVKTQDASQDGPQRKDVQSKASVKSDGREKGGKKTGPPRSAIPPGESRVADMPVGALLLLKDGERMQPPEGVQESLAAIPGVLSLRIEVKAVTSLLSPELRHLLNPVWFLIRDARYLPSTSQLFHKGRSSDAGEGTTENPSTAAAAAATAGMAAPAAVAAVASAALASETKAPLSDIHSRESSSDAKSSTEAPVEYFARAQLFRKVLETDPRRPTRVLGANTVRWDAGFLCFWGPSVENQNELRDFIEERRLEVQLLNTYDLSAMDQSNLYPDVSAGQCKSKAVGRPLLKQPKAANGTPSKVRRATTKAQRSPGGNPEAPSNQFVANCTNAFTIGAEPTPFRPPHGVASFCLSALASCGATHLSYCTDVLPVAGYVARKEEGSGTVQLCRTTYSDFIASGTQISIEIRLAEPLFQHLNFSALLGRDVLNQEGEAVPPSVCFSIPLPEQGINRLFLAAPLRSKVAAEAKQLEQKEEEQSRYLFKDSNSDAGMDAALTREGEADILTGFLITDGRLLYGVLEGHPSGRMSEAAELLLAAAREDEGNSQILYNSRLRFSDRRYCVADLIQTFELKVPLNEIMTPMGLQGKSDSSSLLAFSGLSKLQMATLLSRAADLKCQDLFPTSMELKSIRQLNFL